MTAKNAPWQTGLCSCVRSKTQPQEPRKQPWRLTAYQRTRHTLEKGTKIRSCIVIVMGWTASGTSRALHRSSARLPKSIALTVLGRAKGGMACVIATERQPSSRSMPWTFTLKERTASSNTRLPMASSWANKSKST